MSRASEGGLGSGRKDHQPWMREITQLKTNKHKIPSENMTGSKFSQGNGYRELYVWRMYG